MREGAEGMGKGEFCRNSHPGAATMNDYGKQEKRLTRSEVKLNR